MKRLAVIGMLLSMTLLLRAQAISGEWHGSIEVVDDAPLRLALHVADRNAATLDSVDEGVIALHVESILRNGTAMEFKINSISGVYRGTVAADGSRITGTWSQNGGVWPLNWLKGEDPANIESPMPPDRAIDEGRVCTRWFYEGKTEYLWRKFSPVMQQAFSTERQLADFRQQTIRRLGSEMRVLRETLTVSGALQVYHRTAQFQNVPTELDVRFGFNPAGMIAVLSVDTDPLSDSSAFR